MKIRFELKPGEWHGSTSETLWAIEVGPGQYRLENTPFFADGISYQDVVIAGEGSDVLPFISVVRRSGHSTYRIMPMPHSGIALAPHWEVLERMGCTYEEGNGGLRAVDVPPHVNIFDAYAALQAGVDAGAWDFQEGHCGHSVA